MCQEVKRLCTIEDQMNTQSRKILELPGIEKMEKEYSNIMQGKFVYLQKYCCKQFQDWENVA